MDTPLLHVTSTFCIASHTQTILNDPNLVDTRWFFLLYILGLPHHIQQGKALKSWPYCGQQPDYTNHTIPTRTPWVKDVMTWVISFTNVVHSHSTRHYTGPDWLIEQTCKINRLLESHVSAKRVLKVTHCTRLSSPVQKWTQVEAFQQWWCFLKYALCWVSFCNCPITPSPRQSCWVKLIIVRLIFVLPLSQTSGV